MFNSQRLYRIPPETERLEAEWWKKFAWLEDEYAWCHPPNVRNILRRKYLEKIISRIPGNGIVVDFGCGAGWLSILLAELGAKHVIGIDNAPSQIEIARQRARECGQDSRIEFFDSLNPEALKTADAVIIHGVLHHLSGEELESLAEVLVKDIKPQCKIFMVEPVLGTGQYRPWSLPYSFFLRTAKLRKQSEEEQRIRKLLQSRGDGPRHPGYGVAPKETPFMVGELEKRWSSRFTVSAGEPELFLSVSLVTEMLLLGKTYPKLANFLMRFGLPAYLYWERLSFQRAPQGLWNGWVFCLFEATQKNPDSTEFDLNAASEFNI